MQRQVRVALALALSAAACDGGTGEDHRDAVSDAPADITADAASDLSDEDATDDASPDGDDGADGSGDAAEPPPNACRDAETEGATARCLAPTLPPEHYVAEAEKYFDTLDVSRPEDSIPDYADNVARWEWPPWLLLTALGREDMIRTSVGLRDLDPSTVPERDCRFFEEQPFARCYIVFDYEGKRCPIYEEFTFNAAGQTTFIEAWSDLPGLLPQDRDLDPWAEFPDYPRLSTRIPGLGSAAGTFDLTSPYMAAAAAADPDVADFAARAQDWWAAWFREVAAAGTDYFARGCGWE